MPDPDSPDALTDDIRARASRYAACHRLAIVTELGGGQNGTVYLAAGRPDGPSALKSFSRRNAFVRERAVYERLGSHGVGLERRVMGHAVPLLLNADDALLVIEMTIVERPFVLDFASAALDEAPEFPAEVWEERLAHYADIFGGHWPRVRQIVAAFSAFGVYLLDLSLNNIGFPPDAE